MKTIIHVNQHVIKSNRKNGVNDPVLTIKTYKENRYAHEVEINGPSKIVYATDNSNNYSGVDVNVIANITIQIDNKIVKTGVGHCSYHYIN